MSRQPEDRSLPPDPENMNPERATWAATALAVFRTATRTDPENALADLLCDLMHWCDFNTMDFEAELERARDHYAAETEAPGPLSDMET